NPLISYFVLRYLLTENVLYLYITLLITFIFSLNFSFLSAPGFFAFFPLVLLYSSLYTRWICKKRLPIKGIVLGILGFCLIQSFHLVPHLLSLLFLGSQYNAVFSGEGKFTRGLDYFVAIAPNIKVSLS